MNKEVREFVDRLRQDRNQVGSVCLEFYCKIRNNWAFKEDVLKWEMWTIRIDCVTPFRVRLEDLLMEKVLSIIQAVNHSNSYLPAMPSERLLSSVFDTSFHDVQPYLHKVLASRPSPLASRLPLPRRSATESRTRFTLTSHPSPASDRRSPLLLGTWFSIRSSSSEASLDVRPLVAVNKHVTSEQQQTAPAASVAHLIRASCSRESCVALLARLPLLLPSS